MVHTIAKFFPPFFRELLFRNHGVRQTIVKNVLWLAFSEGSQSLFKFFLLIAAARELGAEVYGIFNFVFSLVSLFAFILDFGLSQYLVREFSRNPSNIHLLWDILSIKVISTPIFFGLLAILYLVIPHTTSVAPLIIILGLAFFFGDFLTSLLSVFRARQKMEYEALPKFIQALIIFGVGLFAIFAWHSVLLLAGAYAIGALSVLVFILYYFHRSVSPFRFTFSMDLCKKTLRATFPIVLATCCVLIYSTVDVILLGIRGTMYDVGIYNAAYRVIGIAGLAGGLIIQGFYPRLGTLISDEEGFMRLWRLQLRLLFIVSGIAVISIYFFAPFIIRVLYSNLYEASIPLLRLLAFSLPFHYLFLAFYFRLFLFHRQELLAWIVFPVAAANVIANYFLIPIFGTYAVAIIMIATYMSLALLFAVVSPKAKSLLAESPLQ